MVQYRRDYDTIIVGCIALELYIFEQETGFYSFTDLYGFVREVYPTVGKDTIQRHLNRMVKEHILVKLPKEYSKSYKNRTLYILTPEGRKFWEQTTTPEGRKLFEETKRRQQQQERQQQLQRQREGPQRQQKDQI